MASSEPIAITVDVAAALGVAETRRAVDLVAAAPGTPVEWAIAAREPTALEVTVVGTAATATVAAAEPYLRRLRERAQALPAGREAIAVVVGAAAPCSRWWYLAPVGGAAAVAATLDRIAPELCSPAAQLAGDTSPASLRAIAAAGSGEHVARTTISFALPSPEALIAVLDRAEIPTTIDGRVLAEGLLGVGRRRSWPAAWMARSLGGTASWTCSYLVARDPARPHDVDLLAAIDADPRAREAWAIVSRAHDFAPVVAALSWEVLDDAARTERWLLHLAGRAGG